MPRPLRRPLSATAPTASRRGKDETATATASRHGQKRQAPAAKPATVPPLRRIVKFFKYWYTLDGLPEIPPASAPDPRFTQPRRQPRASSGWPSLGTAGVVIVLVAIMGTIVAGIQLKEDIQLSIVDSVHSPILIGFAGWALIGVPVLVMAASYRWGRPGPAALGGLIAGLCGLTFGMAIVFNGRGEPARRAREFAETNPDVNLMRPGTASALIALAIGVFVFLPMFANGRISPNRKRDRKIEDSAKGILAMAGAQLLALIATLIRSSI